MSESLLIIEDDPDTLQTHRECFTTATLHLTGKLP